MSKENHTRLPLSRHLNPRRSPPRLAAALPLALAGLLLLAAGPAGAAPKRGCDLNDDGVVNVLDLQTMISVIGGAFCPRYSCDLDGDGQVTVTDYQRVQNDVLGVKACPTLADAGPLLDAMGEGFGGPEDLGLIDVDVDCDMDFFFRGHVGGAVKFVPDASTAAIDLDGDGKLDVLAPIEGLAIDPDGWEPPFEWFSRPALSPEVEGASVGLAIAASIPAEAWTDQAVIYFELHGDTNADNAFYITHVVGELF